MCIKKRLDVDEVQYWKERIEMSYYFSKTIDMPFEQAIAKVVEILNSEGFGILSQIDVKATLKKKLDVDMPGYMILGACNPHFAFRALQAEDKIGTMLPCNVVVREDESGGVEIAAVDPLASMQAIENQELGDIAAIVQEKLKNVISQI